MQSTHRTHAIKPMVLTNNPKSVELHVLHSKYMGNIFNIILIE